MRILGLEKNHGTQNSHQWDCRGSSNNKENPHLLVNKQKNEVVVPRKWGTSCINGCMFISNLVISLVPQVLCKCLLQKVATLCYRHLHKFEFWHTDSGMKRPISMFHQFSAPDGCLQYFTNTSGSIQSFNFKMEQSPYPANLDYAICIKPQQGFCGVHLATSTVGDGE